MIRVWAAGVGCAAFVLAGEALAQEPSAAFPDGAPPVTRPAPAPALDLVRLKDGSMLRGTISEMVPGDFVLIVLITGEKRRIPEGSVAYAGPADGAPVPAPLPVPAAPAPAPALRAEVVIEGPSAHVAFVSEPDGMQLFKRSAVAAGRSYAVGYDELCTAPCRFSLPAGTHYFAVARRAGVPLKLSPLRLPAGELTLIAKVDNRRTARVVVASSSAAVALVGTIALIAGATSRNGGTLQIVGVTALGASLGGFTSLLALGDNAELGVVPGAPQLLLPSGNTSDRAKSDTASGLSLAVRF